MSAARLEARLLQPADLPTLTDRRASASADVTTQATPQLGLCTPDAPVAQHELANVIAKPSKAGQAQVFELLSVYGSVPGARQAFDRAVAAVARCRSYRAGDRTYTVADVRRPAVRGADAALQFRLTTPDVVGGDVLSVALAGTSLVLVTGYGAPPGGQSLLDFQAGVLVKAVGRAAAA